MAHEGKELDVVLCPSLNHHSKLTAKMQPYIITHNPYITINKDNDIYHTGILPEIYKRNLAGKINHYITIASSDQEGFATST